MICRNILQEYREVEKQQARTNEVNYQRHSSVFRPFLDARLVCRTRVKVECNALRFLS